ncbi:MAG: hypothetical protein ACOH1R_00020 [Luteimonas sp.]
MNNEKPDANRDPLTGTPGAHPVGTGVGATAGGIAGAAAGTVLGGPAGTVVGAAIGAIAGGLGGKAAGEAANPTVEDAYWRDSFKNESYYNKQYTYDDYGPAYRTGYENRGTYGDRTFDQAEPDLRSKYEASKGNSRMAWDDAKSAARAAWHRVERAMPGDADGDGR